MEWGMG
jgi:hypothetical protein